MNTKQVIGLVLAVPALMAGCVEVDEGGDPVETTVSAPSTPKGVLPELRYLGPITTNDGDVDLTTRPPPVDEVPPQVAVDPMLEALARGDDGTFGVMYVDTANKAEYVAVYDDAEVKAAVQELARLGYGDASKGAMDPDEVVEGWSNDIDNRQWFGDWSLTHSTLRKVGQVNNGCTGALFGNRLVLTAAHCIFDGNGNYLQFNMFRPRRNGTDPLPYGSVTSQGTLYPIAYKNDGCNIKETSPCVKNDWAILILPPDPWASSPNGAPGYFGVWWADESILAGYDVRNIGYPGCGSDQPMRPAGCVANTAYGDLTCAGVPTWVTDSDSRWPLQGDDGRMMNGCDTSPGHSGGPIYSYSPGSNGPYLLGNATWNQCNSSTCNADSDYSNAGARINDTLAGYMMNLRATYP